MVYGKIIAAKLTEAKMAERAR
jgi:uncharacterized protein (TIGR00251 family)